MVLKKAIREHPQLKEKVKTIIISAKYGLILEDELINSYDLKMTPEIASSQRLLNTIKLNDIINEFQPQSMMVVMGNTYLKSVNFTGLDVPITFISGEIGMMLHSLKQWLNNLNGGEADAN